MECSKQCCTGKAPAAGPFGLKSHPSSIFQLASTEQTLCPDSALLRLKCCRLHYPLHALYHAMVSGKCPLAFQRTGQACTGAPQSSALYSSRSSAPIQLTVLHREDMDVRMLGDGRPFAFEIQNARKCVFTQAFFQDVEDQLQQVEQAGPMRNLWWDCSFPACACLSPFQRAQIMLQRAAQLTVCVIGLCLNGTNLPGKTCHRSYRGQTLNPEP